MIRFISPVCSDPYGWQCNDCSLSLVSCANVTSLDNTALCHLLMFLIDMLNAQVLEETLVTFLQAEFKYDPLTPTAELNHTTSLLPIYLSIHAEP